MFAPPVDTDPRLLPPRVKTGIVACVSLVACTAGFASTIYFPGLPYVTEELHAQRMATTLTAALFVLFLGIAPVTWAAISEHYQVRRFLFLVAMVIFTVTSIGAAFVHNIWALVVVRCIQSIGVACGQSLGAGCIADLYPVEERGAAFGKYMFGAILGPVSGPIVGGFLIMSPLGWRATFWFCCALGIFIFLITFFFTPETFRVDAKFDIELPVANNECIDSAASDKDTLHSNSHRFNPFTAFILLRHPFVFLASVVAALFFAAMFATEAILPDAFKEVYGLSSWQTGLCYLGAGIGNLSGALVGSRVSDRLLIRSRRLRGGAHKAEDRLTANVWIAGFIFGPLGNLLFGWVVEHRLSLWGAVIAFGIQCFGTVQVVTVVTAYLVDALPGRGASATAAATFIRYGISCILSLISTPMIAALGAGWTCTLFACLSWLGMFIALVLKLWGDRIRAWSGF
ncbi:hypothetical protein MUCCIDRAFT_135793 [Mucor lusitanicus CBS 277.49]|uniref:Major facilitator superfamily (MFS) profile domain-containing protein n=1 Tax=Mucor lusitanicus CBS 277.49 TaxID=747725 RepID=A0A168PK46_MUCCL|nr:hypothetical protein MUCCIDRAFT_135793 [Mucor lusitanicus CBS 277.49]